MIVHSFTGHVLLTSMDPEVRNAPVGIELGYDCDHDQYAVRMTITTPEDDGEVTWVFAREMMARAVDGEGRIKVGFGDVKLRVEPHRDRLTVCLTNRDGHADIGLPLADVTEFLDRVYNAVPDGEEYVDEDEIDKFLKEVLG